ncbi:MAG: DNA-protecting protein DprA [Firmicutes bacterium]|nr:DNA-protecting protein DprA [Bacillota bacterium]
MKERDVLIWLSSLSKIGCKDMYNICNNIRNLSLLWEMPVNDFKRIKCINNKLKEEILIKRNKTYFENFIERNKKFNVNIITILDNTYPDLLKKISMPPKVLFIKGNLILKQKPTIGIVGSRKATEYGKFQSKKFAEELSKLGISIVSGMAKGIDTSAHIGALQGRGKTIAVLGSGVDIIYPKCNNKLYDKIVENGTILSEFPLGTQPIAKNFPKRNRIISGLSLGVLVIEAALRSGTLITVNYALDQGREVFSLPGNVNSINSKGTNKLIKDGAKLTTNIFDVIEEINALKERYNIATKKKINSNTLSKKELKVINCIINGPIQYDMISYNTGININELCSIIKILKLKGLIKETNGKIFSLKMDYI